MKDNKYLKPPGSAYSIIAHPSGKNEAIEVAIMREHRFAFYYWFKWSSLKGQKISKNSKPPALISIDWHRDLCQPCDSEKTDLKNLNLESYKDVAIFSWFNLNPLNDGHILAAAYLNLIGDIFVLCKQDREIEPDFIDCYGNTHTVKCFSTSDELYDAISKTNYTAIFFDIDLDYFTESNDPCGGGKELTVVTESEVSILLSSDQKLMKWLFERMEGMTIATEPEFCGGLSNSNIIYNTVDATLFNSTLFSHSNSSWSHL